MKNQYRKKYVKDPYSIREAASNYYSDTIFIDPTLLTNTTKTENLLISTRNISIMLYLLK